MDESVEDIQKQKLAELKENRKTEQVQKHLVKLEKAIDKEENLMPYIIEAVKAYATIGEICGTLRQVFGEYSGYGTI